jgi:hypothetical protein
MGHPLRSALAVLAAVALAPAAAQASVRLARAEASSATEITVFLEVESDDKAMRDIIPAELQLFVDGKPLNPGVTARNFNASGAGMAVVIILDATSPWAGEPWDSIIEGLRSFIGKLKGMSAPLGMIVMYGGKVAKTALSPKHEKVASVLGRLDSPKGDAMELGPALRKAMDLLGDKGLPWRKEVVLNDAAADLFAMQMVVFRLGEVEKLSSGAHKIVVDYMGSASKEMTISVPK